MIVVVHQARLIFIQIFKGRCFVRRDEVSKNQADNLISLLDGYFNGEFGEQHINVNVIDKDMLVHV